MAATFSTPSEEKSTPWGEIYLFIKLSDLKALFFRKSLG